MKLPLTEYEYLRELQRSAKHKRNYVNIRVLLMLHLGKSIEDISSCLGISDSTVFNYTKKYEAEGLDLYLQDHYHGYEGKLNEEEQKILCAELDANLYKNTAEIAVFIREKLVKTYTYQGLAPLLKRLGFSYKKTKLVPCAADLERASGFCERI